MYSPRSRVGFWEQEGQGWKTLQLKAELAEPLGELRLIAGDELGEVGTEELLEGARSPLAVGAGGRCIQAERQLVAHMEKDGPEERGAFTLALLENPEEVPAFMEEANADVAG